MNGNVVTSKEVKREAFDEIADLCTLLELKSKKERDISLRFSQIFQAL